MKSRIRMLAAAILVAASPLAAAQDAATSPGQGRVAARLAASFTAVAGSRENALALVNALRTGQTVQLGFLSIGIAIVTNTEHPLLHPGQIAKLGAELKTVAKQIEKSAYVKERRKLSGS